MKKYFVILLFLVGVCALGFVAIAILRGGTEFARNASLVDCTDRVTATRFHTQRGRNFVLAFSSFSKPPASYPAHVHFVNVASKRAADFDMNGNYFFPLDTSAFIQPQSEYEMTVTFPPNAQPRVSISLQWVQFGRDRDKY